MSAGCWSTGISSGRCCREIKVWKSDALHVNVEGVSILVICIKSMGKYMTFTYLASPSAINANLWTA